MVATIQEGLNSGPVHYIHIHRALHRAFSFSNLLYSNYQHQSAFPANLPQPHPIFPFPLPPTLPHISLRIFFYQTPRSLRFPLKPHAFFTPRSSKRNMAPMLPNADCGQSQQSCCFECVLMCFPRFALQRFVASRTSK